MLYLLDHLSQSYACRYHHTYGFSFYYSLVSSWNWLYVLDAGMSFIKNNVLMWIMSIKDNVVKRKRTTELHLKTKTNSCKGINEAWMIQCPHLLCLLCWLDATWFYWFWLDRFGSCYAMKQNSIKVLEYNMIHKNARLKQNTTFKLHKAL